MSRSRLLASVLCSCLLASAASAAPLPDFFDAGPQMMPETVRTPTEPGARSAEMARLQQVLVAREVTEGVRAELHVSLGAAERKRIDVPEPASGKYLVGVNKPLGVAVDFGAGAPDKAVRGIAAGALHGDGAGGFVWSAALKVEGATALRVHLTGLDLPDGAELYVYNGRGQAFGPYLGRGPLGSGDLFTNTVFGDRLLLQLVAPDGVRMRPFRIDEVGVMGKRFVAPSYGPNGVFAPGDFEAMSKASNLCSYNADCVVNAGCPTNGAVTTARDAVATILFSSQGGQFICTGQLIRDTDDSSVIPYFLTAHHCIGSSGEASSLETYFDYQTTCSNPNCTQPYSNTGETVGATIKATGSSSDYSLLQLSSTPVTPDGNATYLGWLATPVANTNNYGLFRISHPKGAPQAYSEGVVDTSKPTCRTLPRGSFVYSRDTLGATEGGSSGAAVVNGSGQIVGQLYGACGTNLNDVCDAAHNATVDGAFAASYPNLAAFLNPGGGGCLGSGASCTSDSQCCSNNCKGKPGAKTCK